jgi:hypothetical protein
MHANLQVLHTFKHKSNTQTQTQNSHTLPQPAACVNMSQRVNQSAFRETTAAEPPTSRSNNILASNIAYEVYVDAVNGESVCYVCIYTLYVYIRIICVYMCIYALFVCIRVIGVYTRYICMYTLYLYIRVICVCIYVLYVYVYTRYINCHGTFAYENTEVVMKGSRGVIARECSETAQEM